MTTRTSEPTASLYRMATEEHLCPWGLKAKDLLEREGFEVDDHLLTSRAETDRFKAQEDVESTPQVFIGDRRIGGYEDLREYLGKDVAADDETTYQPVVALFSITALMALAAAFVAEGQWLSLRAVEWFVAFSMCGLAYLKLRDVESFSTMFLNYDLLARRVVRYGYVYPFLEAGAGVLMIAGVLTWLSAPVAIFIGAVGAASVIKAVYVEDRELKCACVGGDSNVPLGFVSLTENLMMLGMGIWMLAKPLILG